MPDPQYAYWYSELQAQLDGFVPTIDAPKKDQWDEKASISGYWRVRAAKTKPDTSVMIYRPDPAVDSYIYQVGRQQPRASADDEKAFYDFISSTFPHCSAVKRAEYDAAMTADVGVWPSDGKDVWAKTVAEKLDIQPGDNLATTEELIADRISTLVEKANAIERVTTADEARLANELSERLKVLFDEGDAARAKEKAPFDQGAKVVQDKWLPIIVPAKNARDRLVAPGGLVKQWLKAEDDRIRKEADDARRKRQAEIDAENAAKAKEAEEKGEEAPPPVVLAEPVAPTRPKAASTFGRSTGLRKVTRAKITDIVKLVAALATHKEMVEFAQTLANRAAKAGITLDGMEIEETME